MPKFSSHLCCQLFNSIIYQYWNTKSDAFMCQQVTRLLNIQIFQCQSINILQIEIRMLVNFFIYKPRIYAYVKVFALQLEYGENFSVSFDLHMLSQKKLIYLCIDWWTPYAYITRMKWRITANDLY